MAANHGVIGPFDSSQEDWLSYTARKTILLLTISQRQDSQASGNPAQCLRCIYLPVDQ